MANVYETHPRTFIKTATYRLLCTLAIAGWSMYLGATNTQAVTMSVVIFFLGTFIYYVYDRVWSKFDWRRNGTGDESVARSIVKTIGYRLITVVIAVILAKLLMNGSTSTAVAFAVGQFVINLVLYYAVERVFNQMGYGRVVA